MNLWEGVPRWINTVLLVIVGFIGFNTLFLLLEANEANVIVDFVRNWADFFLAPFEGMFEDQDFLLTALIAVLGYSLAAGIALAIVRSVQATARSEGRAAAPAQRSERSVRPRRDRDRDVARDRDGGLRRDRGGEPGPARERASRPGRERDARTEPDRERNQGRVEQERLAPPPDTRTFSGDAARDDRPDAEGGPATGEDGHDRTQRLER